MYQKRKPGMVTSGFRSGSFPQHEDDHRSRCTDAFLAHIRLKLEGEARRTPSSSGFVLTPPGYFMCIHHAWITLDGKTAIDVTLPNASECWYFGIPFSGPPFEHLHTKLCAESGVWPAYLDLPMDERVVATLKTMRAEGLL
jgi:hypothetical protein